jgi:hypothetical protein
MIVLSKPNWVVALVVSVCAWGCGSNTVAPATPEAEGRVAITQALTEWNNGTSLDSFVKTKSNWVVRDPDWRDGAKLKSFQIVDPIETAGLDLLVRVKISTVSTSGKSADKTVKFTVGLTSQTVILRSE